MEQQGERRALPRAHRGAKDPGRCRCRARCGPRREHGWRVAQQSRPRPRPREPPAQRRPVPHRERGAGRAAPLGEGRQVRHTEPRPWGQGGARPDTARPPGAGGGRFARRAADRTRHPQGTGGHAGRRGHRPPPGLDAAACLPSCTSLWRVTVRAASPELLVPGCHRSLGRWPSHGGSLHGSRRWRGQRRPQRGCSSGQPDSPRGGTLRLQEPVGQMTVYQTAKWPRESQHYPPGSGRHPGRGHRRSWGGTSPLPATATRARHSARHTHTQHLVHTRLTLHTVHSTHTPHTCARSTSYVGHTTDTPRTSDAAHAPRAPDTRVTFSDTHDPHTPSTLTELDGRGSTAVAEAGGLGWVSHGPEVPSTLKFLEGVEVSFLLSLKFFNFLFLYQESQVS